MRTAHGRRACVPIAVAAALVLAGCAGGSATVGSGSPVEVPGATAEGNEFMNELYRDAVESGATEVVLYGASQSTSTGMFEKFSERFPGITIVPQDAADSQTLTKLQVEAESGNRLADLYGGGIASATRIAEIPDVCTKADVRTAPDGVELPYSSDDLVLSYNMRFFSFVYNTELVAEEDAPRSWEDLLDPKWKGQLVMGDPTVIGGLRYVLTALLVPESADAWGEEYLAQLAAQDVNISQNEPTVPADVASGRFPVGVGVFSGYYQAQKAKGAPIEMVFPLDDGGNFLSSSGLCVVKDAPHADAALLYVNWLFSPEGQQVLAEVDNGYGLVPGSPGPFGAPPLDELDRLPATNTDPEFNAPYFAVIDRLFQ
ncbi:extracellular solute-binding protein [Microbacterium betulae]|uniref:Extracellular solute-binding protein n=1 Tax=Microbacterium betulae TaxID=2981139 RepID=A0AA97I5I9_9MICO|nr:extracellular solute-binding protein [Microbacterium sp. AB]WOF22859.1 extracellular solute-binding protein [Microbacterium sp. AB]